MLRCFIILFPLLNVCVCIYLAVAKHNEIKVFVEFKIVKLISYHKIQINIKLISYAHITRSQMLGLPKENHEVLISTGIALKIYSSKY